MNQDEEKKIREVLAMFDSVKRYACGMTSSEQQSAEKVLRSLVPDGVTLKLNHRQATVLAAVLSTISGSPSGPRGASDQVQEMLADAGYDYFAHGTVYELGSQLQCYGGLPNEWPEGL